MIHAPSAFIVETNLDTYSTDVRAGLRTFPEVAMERKVVMTGCESTMGSSNPLTLTGPSWLRNVHVISKISNAL